MWMLPPVWNMSRIWSNNVVKAIYWQRTERPRNLDVGNTLYKISDFSLTLPKHKYRINLRLSHVCVLPWGALHPNKDNRKIVNTLPETNIAPDKWMVGRLVSFRDGLFSGSMLVFGRATQLKQSFVDFPASLAPISRFEHRPSQTNLMPETHESMDRKLFSIYVPKTADLE